MKNIKVIINTKWKYSDNYKDINKKIISEDEFISRIK